VAGKIQHKRKRGTDELLIGWFLYSQVKPSCRLEGHRPRRTDPILCRGPDDPSASANRQLVNLTDLDRPGLQGRCQLNAKEADALSFSNIGELQRQALWIVNCDRLEERDFEVSLIDV
jgi:hypothetical protein